MADAKHQDDGYAGQHMLVHSMLQAADNILITYLQPCSVNAVIVLVLQRMQTEFGCPAWSLQPAIANVHMYLLPAVNKLVCLRRQKTDSIASCKTQAIHALQPLATHMVLTSTLHTRSAEALHEESCQC